METGACEGSTISARSFNRLDRSAIWPGNRDWISLSPNPKLMGDAHHDSIEINFYQGGLRGSIGKQDLCQT